MAEAGQALSRHDLEARIVRHCWADEGFRKEFTADPAGVFVKYLQVPAADLPKIVVHEEPSGSWHIVIPPSPNLEEDRGELSEQDLERVAGGGLPPLVVVSLLTGVSGVSSAVVASISASASITVNEKIW